MKGNSVYSIKFIDTGNPATTRTTWLLLSGASAAHLAHDERRDDVDPSSGPAAPCWRIPDLPARHERRRLRGGPLLQSWRRRISQLGLRRDLVAGRQAAVRQAGFRDAHPRLLDLWKRGVHAGWLYEQSNVPGGRSTWNGDVDAARHAVHHGDGSHDGYGDERRHVPHHHHRELRCRPLAVRGAATVNPCSRWSLLVIFATTKTLVQAIGVKVT